ncbi:tRNA (adenosine(37)-N6)-dimethylallyltransferase MiaA [Carboxylicivirga sediminis]|uniref:tRNA dimethylallyltransferase n=1 Tax=Carboxylicivirga sediminis TaxID=2006564 RepID=A0A941F5Q1_9BACT|nr:tRNA (adenosine(37)-N6)-dimethylallyltransferase MiaA [Carboxylicivirga sediminis]MBR8537311.1 tRNA (adenosine(37)-N6)-dimethylallyltransferase MiaA [Carboxylicivirga sediminis]
MVYSNSPYNLIVVLGPTASGKTTFAAHLAKYLDGEIISADSRQLYRGMDLGTGKDIEDYTIDGYTIPHHLIDIVDAGYKYNVFEYQADFFKAFEQVQANKHWPIMCGGTGMYIESVLKKYKLINVPVNQELRDSLQGKNLQELSGILSTYKSLHNQTDTDTVKRAIRAIEIEEYYKENPEIEVELPDVNPLIIGVNIDREARRRKITSRLKKRLDEGMIDEVKQLLDSGVEPEDLIYYGLEYKYLTMHVMGQLSYKQMFDKLNVAIHQFAKRQMTWFRGMERKGANIHWIDAFDSMNDRIANVTDLLKG